MLKNIKTAKTANPTTILVPDVLANCTNGKQYAVSVKFAFGHWCVQIECGMGAWGSWRIEDARNFGNNVYIQCPSLAVTNMREVVAAALPVYAKATKVLRIEGECS